MSFRPRTAVNVAVVALVGLVGLTGCQSQPGHRRVVLDLIESLNLPADQEQCMKDKLGDYTNSDLDQITDENDALDFSTDNYVESGSDLYQKFVEDLRSCVDGESVATTEAGGTTEVTETTESSDTTEAVATTEGTETTASSDTTEAVETTEA